MMDTQIFKLKLSVHATSLYILVTELVEGGVRPTILEIRARFNASEEETQDALSELLLHKVLYLSSQGEPQSYHPNPASLWEMPGS
ncbi:MAG: hypothetical protein LBE27_02585 [Deltaproteobacteria bacterium]|jgi:hypothetical protein|nr:hypothetical protein [Deltaproteobacteria bacterium]